VLWRFSPIRMHPVFFRPERRYNWRAQATSLNMCSHWGYTKPDA
jgi:hypothetical protein